MAQPPQAANAQPAVDFDNALENHDAQKRTTQFPLYYGRPEKETTTAQMLIDRIEHAASVPAVPWTDNRKCVELYMCLRDKAQIWYSTLEFRNIDTHNWETFKTRFLSTYEPKYTAKTSWANFTDLSQKSGETVTDFFGRVITAVKIMKKNFPPEVSVATDEERGAVAQVNANRIKKFGVDQSISQLAIFLFIAGLKDDIRMEVGKTRHANIDACLQLATDTETQLNENKKKLGLVQAVAETETIDFDTEALKEWAADEVDQLSDQKINAINLVRKRFNRPLINRRRFGGNGGNGNRSGSGSGKKNLKCHFCKKMGHFQAECRSRIAQGAPMVGPDGKPYNNRVNAVQNEPAAEQNAARVQNIAHLNW